MPGKSWRWQITPKLQQSPFTLLTVRTWNVSLESRQQLLPLLDLFPSVTDPGLLVMTSSACQWCMWVMSSQQALAFWGFTSPQVLQAGDPWLKHLIWGQTPACVLICIYRHCTCVAGVLAKVYFRLFVCFGSSTCGGKSLTLGNSLNPFPQTHTHTQHTSPGPVSASCHWFKFIFKAHLEACPGMYYMSKLHDDTKRDRRRMSL